MDKRWKEYCKKCNAQLIELSAPLIVVGKLKYYFYRFLSLIGVISLIFLILLAGLIFYSLTVDATPAQSIKEMLPFKIVVEHHIDNETLNIIKEQLRGG